MPDINWGGDETTAPLSSRYDEAAGDLILAEDNDGNTVLLEWDGTTWQYRGPVEMNGEDVSGVGTLTATDVVADSVSTGEADITNETFVKATLTSTKSGLASGTYHNIADTEVEDNRGELDGSFNFVPDESGWYKVTARVHITSGADQDEYEIVVYDNDASNYEERHRDHSSTSDYGDAVTFTLKLTAGTSYSVRIKNRNSSFDLGSFRETGFTITKAVTHP